MDLVQKRKQLRQRQVEKVKKFRQSNMSASAAAKKQKERDEMKKEIRKEIEKETRKESMNIENSDGTTFARVMDIIGPTHMRPLVSNGVWKGTEQISEKKSDCECDDCGQDPCIECGESHHSIKKESISYGSKTAREGDNEAAAAARKRIYDRASDKDKDHMDAREIADQRNKERHKKVVVTKEAKEEQGRSDYGKASVRNKRKFGKEGEPAIFDASGERGKMIDSRRAEHKAKRGVKTKGVKEDYYSGTGEKVVARTKKFMDKKGMKGAPGLDAMKARTAEHKAKRGVKEEVVAERTGSPSTFGDMNSRFFSGDKNTNITNNVTQGGQGAALALGAIGGAAALHYGKKAAKSIGKSVKKTKDKIKRKFKKEEYSNWRSEIDEGVTAASIGTAAALGLVGGAASAIGNMSTRGVVKKLDKKKKTDEKKKESYNWREDKTMRINKILNN